MSKGTTVDRQRQEQHEPDESGVLLHTGTACPGIAVDQRSTPEAKIDLFRSLFRGREDVYPRRFESRKTGKSGYRRDRRKDALLQENGYFVLRFLADDVGKRLDHVLDTILRALVRRNGGSRRGTVSC